jgi:hypothetical protein
MSSRQAHEWALQIRDDGSLKHVHNHNGLKFPML